MISCIYKIESISTSRIYIGSAINFNKRKSGHICSLKKGKHHSHKLQNHFLKYGISDLIFSIVESINISNKQKTLLEICIVAN